MGTGKPKTLPWAPLVHVYVCADGFVVRYAKLARRKVINPEYNGYMNTLQRMSDAERDKWRETVPPPEFVEAEGYEPTSVYCPTAATVAYEIEQAHKAFKRAQELGVTGFGVFSFESGKP